MVERNTRRMSALTMRMVGAKGILRICPRKPAGRVKSYRATAGDKEGHTGQYCTLAHFIAFGFVPENGDEHVEKKFVRRKADAWFLVPAYRTASHGKTCCCCLHRRKGKCLAPLSRRNALIQTAPVPRPGANIAVRLARSRAVKLREVVSSGCGRKHPECRAARSG
jgi:hypothetical protein